MSNLFVGRSEQISKLMSTEDHCFIFGARRIGKTMLLQHLEKMFWEKSIPAFYFSIEGQMTSAKLSGKVKNSFRRNNNFTVPNLQFDNLSFVDFLTELNSKLDKQIIFLIDEVEQLAKIEENEEGFISRLRSSILETENIRFILTASPHFKKLSFKSHCSTFLSAFTNMVLPEMTKEEASQIIRKKILDADHEKIDQILGFTHYQPYLIVRFLDKVYRNNRFHEPSEKIARKTYIDNQLNGIFPNYFDGLNEQQQKIVRQINKQEFNYEKDYQMKLEELISYGYLKSETDKYKISNWFFEQWLNGEKFEEIEEAEADHQTKSKFGKVVEYFKDAINKLLVKIVLIILGLALFLFLGKELKSLEWLFKLFK